LEGDEGRNKNIANATQNALQLLRKLFQNEENEQ
jgi:nicotinamide-nucleotide amidase